MWMFFCIATRIGPYVGAVKAYHCDCLERVVGENGGPEAAVAK